jgi:hypothetical protein
MWTMVTFSILSSSMVGFERHGTGSVPLHDHFGGLVVQPRLAAGGDI